MHQRLGLQSGGILLVWTALTLVTASAQTLRSEPGVSTLSPADEAVIPEVDETVSLAQREVFGIALAALVIFVAAGGGTGGGGVLDPIYILVCGLSAKVRPTCIEDTS